MKINNLNYKHSHNKMIRNTLIASLAAACLGAQLDTLEPMELAETMQVDLEKYPSGNPAIEDQYNALIAAGRGKINGFNALVLGNGWIIVKDA